MVKDSKTSLREQTYFRLSLRVKQEPQKSNALAGYSKTGDFGNCDFS